METIPTQTAPPAASEQVTIPRARLAELEALERQVADGDVLAQHQPHHGRREWASVGTWLYAGDRVVVLRS